MSLLIDIVPDFRDDSFFVVDDEIVILDRSRRVVDVVPAGEVWQEARTFDERAEPVEHRGPGHAESVSLEGGVACSPSPAHAAAAGCRTDRDPDEIRQAARLATWEDEGGTTSS